MDQEKDKQKVPETQAPESAGNAENAENAPDLMTLADEDGNEVTFEVIDALDCEGVHYMAVVEYADPEKPGETDDQMIILRVGTDEDGEFLDVVDDDEQLLKIGKLFEARLSDRYDIQE